MKRCVIAGLAFLMACSTSAARAAELTDDDVRRAIDKGREYLVNLQNGDGSFSPDPAWRGCYSALAAMTLAYMGEHPNRPVMQKALNYVASLVPERDFANREGYAVPIRVMCMAYVYHKVSGEKQAGVKKLMQDDLARLINGQSLGLGGWRYKLNRTDCDFSVSQWPILAMYEANRLGVEFPKDTLLKAKAYYYHGQHTDGGWGYMLGIKNPNSYGSMTAAGAASLFTISDLVEPASGCPCKGGESQKAQGDIDRRIDAALTWLGDNFDASRNPGWEFKTNFDEIYYWLYSAERVGIMAGYKYFGKHNWYKEGAEALVKKQRADGSWMQVEPKQRAGVENWGGGQIPDTCFALLFLFKGRAPVLFNKLRFEGTWNPHRRDLAHLTRYIEWAKEQQFHWQIVDLAAPVDELHDAPILYLCAESVPKWNAADRQKLRRFTDTGGTLLVEASCGNPNVRKWVDDFAKMAWPEWPLEALPEDHPVFCDPYPLTGKQRPEVKGIHDGVRTIVYYSPDDVSCAWHMKALAQREYLFKWGINLFTCATDKAPLRAKLAVAPAPESDRYEVAVRAGPRAALRIARVKHSGNWEVGANYGSFENLADRLKKKAKVGLKVAESSAPPVTREGVPPANLPLYDVAYVAGNKPFTFTPAERDDLKAFIDRGGFLWCEDVGGLDWGERETPAGKVDKFDEALRQLAMEMRLTTKPLPPTHPILSGRMDGAIGYDLTSGVSMRRALRMKRAAMTYAQLIGLYAGDRLVGVYSPYDVMFSTNEYEAYNCKGYKPADAEAIATNIVLYLTTLTPAKAAPGAEKAPPEKTAEKPGPEPEAPPTEKTPPEEKAPAKEKAPPGERPSAPEKPPAEKDRPDAEKVLPWQ